MKTEVPALNQSVPVLAEIGQIHCIATSPDGKSTIRYYGQSKHASGHAHETPEQAEADVRAWFRGEDVPYTHHVPLPIDWKPTPKGVRVGDIQQAIDRLSTPLPTYFTIGPDNTYQQAWRAMLSGHRVRRPSWDENVSWVFESNAMEIMRVYGNTLADWRKNGLLTHPTGKHQLAIDWIVLPKVDHEPVTI